MVTRDFEFMSGNKKLSGTIDQPRGREAEAIIILIHGSGGTDIRGENRYFDLRSRFAPMGITCVMWDKPGQGRSQGMFDDNQPLEESAQEVVDAIRWLRAEKIPGFKKIVIWGASRGGWVVPIALSRDAGVKYWISVSGVSGEDNKYYLIKANLPLEGRSEAQTALLMKEFKRGREIFFQGGDYETFLAATEHLRKDTSVFYFAGDLTGTKETFVAEQTAFLRNKDKYPLDENLSTYRVPNFAAMLKKLDVNVLALFGDKDTNVDWRNAKSLYETTIGQNPRATLATHTLPNCSHNMRVSATGSIRQVDGVAIGAGAPCKGYYETQLQWLKKYVVSK